MALFESWHIRSRARECAATGRPFASGETIVTALFPDTGQGGFARLDFSLDAWRERGPDEAAPFSSWRSIYTPPGGDKPAKVEKEDPEDILRRLVEEDADHTENTRYILAVMLERRKLLVETDTQRTPTGILRIYENRRSGEVYIVKDPNVPLDQVDALQQEVIALLETRDRPAGEDETAPDITAPVVPPENSETSEPSEPAPDGSDPVGPPDEPPDEPRGGHPPPAEPS